MAKVVNNRSSMMDLAINKRSVKQQFVDALQYKINNEFNHASDVFDFEEETTIGSKEFQPITARITHIVYNSAYGRLGDDYKEIIFKNIDHARGLGQLYRFDNNIWITINSDYYKYPTASVVVRRCNNVLRYINEQTGEYYEEPCFIEDSSPYDNGAFRIPIPLPKGTIQMTCQSNLNTNIISHNRRFLFGNYPNAYRISSMTNFRSNNTFGNNDPLLTFEMEFDPLKETDNTELRIADYFTNVFDVSIVGGNIEQMIGYSTTMTAVVKRDNVLMNTNLVWESSDDTVAKVDSNGVIELISDGSCVVRCSVEGNPLFYDEISVVVTDSPDIEIENIISPENFYILQGDTVVYEVFQHENGEPQSTSFVFSYSGVPSSYFEFIVLSGNSFSIKNKKRYTGGKLNVVCTPSDSNDPSSYLFTLAGVF